jgi:hypothetical protein
MEFSEYENIEIFINTQRNSINKCGNQIIEESKTKSEEFYLHNIKVSMLLKLHI